MYLTQRNQYALRAIVELARQVGKGPVKVSEIAKAQAIPLRFLEVILGQLKGSGLVDAKRGYYGGYFLLRQPEDITVGSVVRFLQGEPDLKECQSCISNRQCPFENNCAFASLWSRVNEAVFNIYDETTIKDLVPDEPVARF
ncbi:MAG: Rrf2 family transcriptional regulator [Desulfobacterales bacterium]|nr:Rrf2 family transcriptional regulator [Desulfobacterales bacterium]MDJ0874745.1 Rrf2 family transcriptional regulator [Desulfobacterales bacterium]